MWVLIILAGFVAVVCLAAFVRGSSSSYGTSLGCLIATPGRVILIGGTWPDSTPGMCVQARRTLVRALRGITQSIA